MTTIDIALTNVDINQCDRSSSGQFQFEIFAGTHRCKNETTQVRLDFQKVLRRISYDAVGRFAAKKGSLRSPRGRLVASLSKILARENCLHLLTPATTGFRRNDV